MRLEQGYRFGSLDELEEHIRGIEPTSTIEMDRIQYAEYKTLVYEWLQRLNPISVFEEHPIEVIRRADEVGITHTQINNEV